MAGATQNVGVPYTILGPTYFFDNALGEADRIRSGVLDLPLPGDRQLQQLGRPGPRRVRRPGAP